MTVLLKSTALLVGGALVALVGLGAASALGVGPLQVRETDRSQPVLLKSITDISEYHAAVGNFEVVVDKEEADTDWLPDLITGRRTLLVAAGTVDAYVDLSSLAERDLTLSADGTSVTIRLPEAQLDEPNLDQDRTYVFTQERGVVDRILDAMETPQQAEFYALAEMKLAAAAAESELPERATDNTEAMLTGMFGSLGIDVIFIAE